MLYPYLNSGDYGNSSTLSIVFVGINGVLFYGADYITKKYTKVHGYLFEQRAK